jgi:hypothetical protein
MSSLIHYYVKNMRNIFKILTSKINIIIGISCLILYVIFIFIMIISTGKTFALIEDVPKWFDPVFFQYNLLLSSFAVMIIPSITIFYVRRMRYEKIRRLRIDMPYTEWQSNERYIRSRVRETFQLRNYIGSMLTLTLIVLFGVSIIALFKPLPSNFEQLCQAWVRKTGSAAECIYKTGIDFSRGANFLMLGPFMQWFVQGKQEYINKLMASLTAFQFGFLGAYVYFIGHLVRGYFTMDLTPNTFVSSSVRMAIGSILALVLAFVYPILPETKTSTPDGEGSMLYWLPILSFFIGYFPSRGMIILEAVVVRLFPFLKKDNEATPLRILSGMSYAHEVRLLREGLDNVENLATASWIDLAIRTGFTYKQLQAWVGEAWLRVHLRSDYEEFLAATGIMTAKELYEYGSTSSQFQGTGDQRRNIDWSNVLTGEAGKRIAEKVKILEQLLPLWLQGHTVEAP